MIPKFNPGFQSDQEAIANFVVRRFQFEQIIDALGTAARSGGAPPRFVVAAPRGAGKTTLCRRVVAEIRTRPELERHWQAIFLGEESYTVTSSGEFLLEVLLQLNDQLPAAQLSAALAHAEGASTEDELIARSLGALSDCANRVGKRLLIVVENFHMILADQIQESAKAGQGLVGILGDDTIFSVLATSVTKALNEDEPDFPDYSLIELKPLSLKECKALWMALTGDDIASDRIRPIQILTGGSPRLVHILADFMKSRSLRDLMENLNFLIDQNTEYFKSQMDALPTVERKVFAALLEIWDPSTAKQVAEAARVNTNVASAMLARLTERGAVIKEPGQGRTAIYFASERLFNIYYLMRRRSHPSGRVKALVTFMVEFYSSEELVDTTALLVREACSVEPSSRDDYHFTFDQILSRSSESVRDKILRTTPMEFIRSFRQAQHEFRGSVGRVSALSNSDNRLTDLISQIESAADDGDFVTARGLILEAQELDRTTSELWVRLAFVENELGNPAAAIAAAETATAIAANDPWAHTVLALALRSQNKVDDALVSYRRALSIDPGHEPALIAAASLLEGKKGDPDAALALYGSAFGADALGDLSRVMYAQLLSRQERLEEAEALLRDSAEQIDNDYSRRALVDLLHSRGRSVEAQRFLENLAQREERWEAFADLGRYLLLQTDNGAAARDALRTAIEMGASNPIVYSGLARSMMAAEHSGDEVSAVALEMVSKFPEDAGAWIRAGFIHQDLDNEAEAETAFRSAFARKDGEYGYVALARLLEANVSRQAEVEPLLRQAVQTISGRGRCAPMRQLAEFLIHKGDDGAAEQVLRDAVLVNDRCSCCYVLQGDLARGRSQFQEAEERYRRALAVDDEDVNALTGLAQLVDKSEAVQLIERALVADPDDPRVLLTSLQLNLPPDEGRLERARSLVQDSPDHLEARLFLATMEAQAGHVDEAIDNLSLVLSEVPTRRDAIPLFVKAAMAIVECGAGEKVSALLAAHKNGGAVEPLAIAVQLKQGLTPLVANEVMEVARDIVRGG
ncbi:tetratricopeptide repeat protein [Mesorhizobium sp. M0320]|uniref:tetratricopeptide repeat protein n=1 Tax=Mesorhizobium sp. M0320 TaxID=2956936 RepID=UPI0033359FC9